MRNIAYVIAIYNLSFRGRATLKMLHLDNEIGQ
jgi:hypothetical protein